MKKKRAVIASDPIGRYREILSPEAVVQLETCLTVAPPSAVRFNPLKGSPLQMVSNFQPRIGWSLQPIPFCPDGYTVDTSLIPPGRSLEARLGYFYIQDAASMLPVELFETINSPAPFILDLTAAPGGKSTHLASRFHDRGILITNDGTASRIPALTSTLKTWGAVSSAVTNIPGEMFGQWFPETFDCVLLDAPCSMENLHAGDKNKRDIQSAERGRLAQRQVQLLISAIKACKVGGQVVYSTCTLAPEEDEGVLDVVLKFAGKSVQISEVGSRMGITAPGLTKAFGQKYSEEIVQSVRLWPHILGTSGFFTAHMQKTGALPEGLAGVIQRPFNRSNMLPLQSRDIQKLAELLLQNHGVNLTEILGEQDLTLSAYKQSVYIFPRALETQFTGVPFRSTGLRLGDYTESGFEISLEWATRYGEKITGGIFNLPEELRRSWSRGEDIPSEVIGMLERGSILVIKDLNGLVLGTGRVSSRGLKNLLPRHLALKS
jgi:16S rRNA (cytosine1407-C5)-methyltransferase